MEQPSVAIGVAKQEGGKRLRTRRQKRRVVRNVLLSLKGRRRHRRHTIRRWLRRPSGFRR
jgi:hypothetical protein